MIRRLSLWTLVGAFLALNESAESASGGQFAEKLRQTVASVAKSRVTISDIRCDSPVVAGFRSSSDNPRSPASLDSETISRASIGFKAVGDTRSRRFEAEFLGGALSQIRSLSTFGVAGREIVVEDRVWKSLSPKLGEFRIDAVGRDSRFEISNRIEQKSLIEKLGPLIEKCCGQEYCRRSFLPR